MTAGCISKRILKPHTSSLREGCGCFRTQSKVEQRRCNTVKHHRKCLRAARPVRRIARLRVEVDAVTCCKDSVIFASMALRGAHVADAAVPVINVVPADELSRPCRRCIEIIEALRRERGAVLGRAEQRLCIGVVVTDPRSGVRGRHAQPVQHSQHGRGLKRGNVVAVQDRLVVSGSGPFGPGRATDQRGMVRIVSLVNFSADDLAAVGVEHQMHIAPCVLALVQY